MWLYDLFVLLCIHAFILSTNVHWLPHTPGTATYYEFQVEFVSWS